MEWLVHCESVQDIINTLFELFYGKWKVEFMGNKRMENHCSTFCVKVQSTTLMFLSLNKTVKKKELEETRTSV